MNPYLHRAQVLLEQSRFAQAEAELRQVLAQEPDNPLAHALLSLSLAEQNKLKEATDEARHAIGLAPDFPYAHHALARALQERGRPEEALVAAEESVRLDPAEPSHHAMVAGIRLSQRRWTDALAAAERGLEQDAGHVGCTNLRAMALTQLGRRAEAGETIATALAHDPENAVTHANEGWRLLHQGRNAEALEHFRESLRLEPGNEWGRAGLVEALKARHLLYALMLRYFLWMSRLSPGVQWGVVLGGYFGSRMLSSAAKANPELAPWILPVQILYIVFALLTWTADPLFNLLLRLSRHGRHALTDEQRVAVHWFGGFLVLALGMLGIFLGTSAGRALLGALVFGLLLVPVTAVFRCQAGWPRWSMAAIAAALTALGVTTIALAGRPNPFGSLFFLGVFLSMWAGNLLAMQRPKL